MKVQWFRVAALSISVCAPTLAQGYCAEPRRYGYNGFEDQVSGYIDHLLCLHNEQVNSLNEHARLINKLGDEIDGLRRSSTEEHDTSAMNIMRGVVVKYSEMEVENEKLRRRVAELEVRLDRIEGLTEGN